MTSRRVFRLKSAGALLFLALGVQNLHASDKPSWKPRFYLYTPPEQEVSTSTVFRSVDPQIINKLIQLLDETHLGKLESGDNLSLLESLKTLSSPEGQVLKNRYTRLGVALSEALGWEEIKRIRVISEQNLKQRLTTVARWDSTPEVRSIALIALASLKDKNDIVYFREAFQSRNIGIRYAAVEALLKWKFPEAVPTLKDLAQRDDSQLIRQFAAFATVQLGDNSGLEILRKKLDDPDWFVRALSARYLGDVGNYQDYDLLLDRLNQEQIATSNEFIIAELTIGALKLFPQKLEFDKQERERKKRLKKEKLLAKQGLPVPPPEPEVQPAPKPAVELDPLVVTAPRLRIPDGELVDSRVNYQLLKIAQGKQDMRITQEQAEKSVSYNDLNFLVTPKGIGLKYRYTVLGYLLTEGLAGTKDFQLEDQLIRIAKESGNPDVRSYALIALAYCQNRLHLNLFQDALRRADSVSDRFAAVEALQIWGYQDAVSILQGVSKLDASPLVQVYATQALWRMGDSIGRDYLLPFLDHKEWLIRAMAMHYLGELGTGQDYGKLLGYFGSIQPDIVYAEMCTSLLRLYSKKSVEDSKEAGK